MISKDSILAAINNPKISIPVSFVIGVLSTIILYPSKTIEDKTRTEVTTTYEQKIKDIENIHSIEKQELQASNTKTLETIQSESLKSIDTLKSQISTLSNENSNLKKKVNEEWTKVTKIDGTIEEKRITSTVEDKTTETNIQTKAEIDKQINIQIQTMRDESSKEISELNSKHQIEIDSMKQTVSTQDQTIKQLQEKSTVTTTNTKKLHLGVGLDTDKDLSIYSTYDILGPIFIGGRVDATMSKTIPRAGIIIGIGL